MAIAMAWRNERKMPYDDRKRSDRIIKSKIRIPRNKNETGKDK